MSAMIQSLLGRDLSEISSFPLFQDVEIPELEMIGDEGYVEFQSLGFAMVVSEERVISAIHLYSEGHEGYLQFAGTVPAGASFSMSRGEVRSLLGKPVESGDGGAVMLPGLRPAWDAFHVDGQRLHFEYSENKESVRLITIQD